MEQSKAIGLDEAAKEVIENALYATHHFLTTECETLADGIVTYLKDAGFEWQQNQHKQVAGMKWVKASERLPDLIISVNVKVYGRPGFGKFYKEGSCIYFGFEASNGFGTLEENSFTELEWLDES